MTALSTTHPVNPLNCRRKVTASKTTLSPAKSRGQCKKFPGGQGPSGKESRKWSEMQLSVGGLWLPGGPICKGGQGSLAQRETACLESARDSCRMKLKQPACSAWGGVAWGLHLQPRCMHARTQPLLPFPRAHPESGRCKALLRQPPAQSTKSPCSQTLSHPQPEGLCSKSRAEQLPGGQELLPASLPPRWTHPEPAAVVALMELMRSRLAVSFSACSVCWSGL